ncbi:hypothetical protein FML11_02400 [Klebsiella oxytoca]|uniref:hypothetical protein n=1 Tax=Klebsiella oxytoca TaxID=571 RepID=UPI001CCF345B|nr:hypothetical protein [Klebsiella oxytoca]MBZ7632145.1 hypothetical protein [Klebsiella oxytoca]CAG0332337.1 hypothetical protein AN2363V1_3817 [Klebsiella oxytoca]CAH6169459.1 hypothetical protein AN2363V1_3817 [Klebsiella oxytoca]
MDKYSEEQKKQIVDVAAIVVGASIALYQMTKDTPKYNSILGEQEKSMKELEQHGFSLETDIPGINTNKLPEYYVVENGERILKFDENYPAVRYWYYRFTSY